MPATEHNPAKIKCALMLRGYRQADVAGECGVENNTVWAVIHGRSRSRKIENRIAAITGISLADLWPQWHGQDATRRRRRAIDVVKVAEALRTLEAA